jgi:outer membrane protein
LGTILASSLFANAQAPFSKGTISAGGSLGINTGSSKTTNNGTVGNENSNFGFNIGLQGQYFLTDKISLGAGLGFASNSNTNKTPNISEVTISNTNFDFGVFGRYYLMLDDKFGFFGQARVSLGTGTSTNETKNIPANTTVKNEGTNSNFGINLTPGLVYFPTPRIGLEASIGNVLGFNSTTQESGNNKTTSSQISLLNVNTLSFNIGFMYYFGK